MIAYSFPPEGRAGTYRPLRFVRHLPALDWRASVISSEHSYSRYDAGLLDLVPSDTEVIRVPWRDPWQAFQARRNRQTQEKLSGASVNSVARVHATHHTPFRSRVRELVRKAEKCWYRPDMAMPWIRPAVKATVNLCARKQYRAIWATAGPVSSFVVAQRASQRSGVPYVLDFRDPWTITGFEDGEPELARRKKRRTMYQLLKGAQSVVFMFDTVAECFWRAYPGALDASRIHIIPNGYEGAIDGVAPPSGDKCTVLYTGMSTYYRYDTLFQALHRLKETDSARAKQLRFLFVGEGNHEIDREAAALGISDIVAAAGSTSQAEISRLQQQAHALLMLGQPPNIKGYELFASAKLFAYLKAGRPIIGVLPPNESKNILLRMGVSTVADVDSPAEIAAVLSQLVDAWLAKKMASLVPDSAGCEVYSAERQTSTLVGALEGVPPTEPFVPGSVDIPPSLKERIGDRGWLSGRNGD